MTEIEMKAAEIAAATKAAEDAAKEAKAETAALREELAGVKAENDNLDASMKAQAKTIEEMQAKLARAAEKMTLKAAFREALEAKRDVIEKMFAEKKAGSSITLEIKTAGQLATGDITDRAYFGTVGERGVSSAPTLPLAFLSNLPTDLVSAASVAWLEGAYTSGADYVAELATAPDASATVAEKRRAFGKIADHILLSSELQNFIEEVYNWATGEAVRKIDNKADYELFNGAGSDATNPRKVYGIKANSTAFSALAAGSYGTPTAADVLMDAIMQIAKEGYTADLAVVSYATLAELRAIKDTTGNYIFDTVNNRLGQLRVVASANVGAAEAVVLDSNCARVKRQPLYELEIVRNAAKDGWDVYVRRGVQLVEKTADKKGVIYIASVATAKTALAGS